MLCCLSTPAVEYCYVCLCVCPWEHISGSTLENFSKYSVRVACVSGSVLLLQCCNMYHIMDPMASCYYPSSITAVSCTVCWQGCLTVVINNNVTSTNSRINCLSYECISIFEWTALIYWFKYIWDNGIFTTKFLKCIFCI